MLTFFRWDLGNFEIQPPCEVNFGDDFSIRLCTDHIQLPNLGLGSFNLNTDDFGLLCGDQPGFSIRFSSRPLIVEFRAGQRNGNFRGFFINVMCTEPTLQFQTSADTFGRFRRETDEGLEINVRGKRLAVSLPVMTSENCTVLREMPSVAPSSTPPTTPPPRITLNGSQVDIPVPAFLTYDREVLTVIQDETTLATFNNITRLFFWTGFNGTRVFTGSAPIPSDEIFGGGRLRIEVNGAYYVNFRSPPQFEPNSEELDITAFLLNATNPLFDQLFPPLTTPPTTAEPTITTKPAMPGYQRHYAGKRETLHYDFIQWKRYASYYMPTTPPSPPLIDPQAMELALMFENACNPYLRQACRSVLNLVQGTSR